MNGAEERRNEGEDGHGMESALLLSLLLLLVAPRPATATARARPLSLSLRLSVTAPAQETLAPERLVPCFLLLNSLVVHECPPAQ